jgi:hypothetical protein
MCCCPLHLNKWLTLCKQLVETERTANILKIQQEERTQVAHRESQVKEMQQSIQHAKTKAQAQVAKELEKQK